jgi:hypothetical protein
MDTLALLCNLHADGPATLQKLRRAGIDSIGLLVRRGPLEIAASLDWNERAAERFLREAALLAERLDEELPASPMLEGHEDEETEALSAGDDWQDEEPGQAEPGFAPPPERIEAVLGAWRELDRVSPPGEPREYELPRPVQADAALTELPGLSERLRWRLQDLGIRSLRALIEARDVDLARDLPLGFTRLKHLQFLATRALEALPEPLASAASPARFREASAARFDTAGPFA